MNTNQSHRGKKQKIAKKLLDDLAEIDSGSSSISSMEENELLSLIAEMADEALKGVDIATQYQTFYQKLLNNAALREAFIDAIAALETEKEDEMIPLPGVSQLNLSFLSKKSAQQPVVARQLQKNQWQLEWHQAIDRLQEIFFPQLLPTLRRSNLAEDTWVTILREETEVEGALYLVILECGVLDDTRDAISVFLSVAVTFKSETPVSRFPIYASLNWGKYSETLKITEDGRVRFPDIPFTTTFDTQYQNIISELKFELVISP